MSPTTGHGGTSREFVSSIACHICRKRKVKCTRELPKCSICQKSSQECTYPIRARRPGPKIGSTHSARKKTRVPVSESPTAQAKSSRRRAQEPVSSSDHETTAYLHDKNRKSPSQKALTRSNSMVSNPLDLQNLSFIIHPSHESCSPGQRQTDLTGAGRGRGNDDARLEFCCFNLGVDLDTCHKL